jgi:hypothetical protein
MFKHQELSRKYWFSFQKPKKIFFSWDSTFKHGGENWQIFLNAG